MTSARTIPSRYWGPRNRHRSPRHSRVRCRCTLGCTPRFLRSCCSSRSRMSPGPDSCSRMSRNRRGDRGHSHRNNNRLSSNEWSSGRGEQGPTIRVVALKAILDQSRWIRAVGHAREQTRLVANHTSTGKDNTQGGRHVPSTCLDRDNIHVTRAARTTPGVSRNHLRGPNNLYRTVRG